MSSTDWGEVVVYLSDESLRDEVARTADLEPTSECPRSGRRPFGMSWFFDRVGGKHEAKGLADRLERIPGVDVRMCVSETVR